MADNSTLPATGDVIASDDVAGVKYQRVKIAVGADGTANDQSVAAAGIPKVGNTDALGQVQYNFPAGFVRTSDEPHQLFYDPFDSVLDTTSRWNAAVSAGGGVAASVTGGILTLGSGTTIGGYSSVESQSSFTPTIPAWLGASFAISFSDGAATFGTNASRFWGIGSSPLTPTAAVPITDGYGFEIDTTGAMNAVVFASGVRTVVAALSTVADTASHRYIVYYRTDRTFWYIDSLATPVATSNFQTPNVQTLPVKFSAVAHTSAPGSSRAISCTGLAVWDTGKNNNTLSDGTYGWRKATVKPASVTAVATDTALVVALHPNSPLPAGNNLIGAVSTPDLLDVLRALLREQVITNQLLQSGLNVPGDLDAYRNELS